MEWSDPTHGEKIPWDMDTDTVVNGTTCFNRQGERRIPYLVRISSDIRVVDRVTENTTPGLIINK